ncbi:hypothetical protein CJF32_00009931 [Rutstroemia sp. NJR-2017a WRK4]|nr:hypothetical protein CJF32_00009931 [Rutstroemia sp. NJR-2017a WRK4]
MNTTSAYTPLECLLLFQSLVAYGTDSSSFVRISHALTNNPLVKDGETYDAKRLSADSLGSLYLRLVREELRSEAEQDAQEEPGQSPTKKRKLSNSPLPSLKDAQDYREKLPQLVDRLYSRYREYMIRAIEEDEENYRNVQRDIAAIERGEWDERMPREEQLATNQNGHGAADGLTSSKTNRVTGSGSVLQQATSQEPKPAEPKLQESRSVEPKATGIRPHDARSPESKPTELQHPQARSIEIAIPPPLPQLVKDQGRAKASPSPGLSPRTEGRPEGLAISDVLNTQNSTPVPTASHPPPDQQPRNGNANQHAPPFSHQRSGSHGPHGPHGPSPLQIHAPQPGPPLKWEPPFHPGPHPQHQYQAGQPGSPHPSPHTQFYPPQQYPPPHGYPPHSYPPPPPPHRNSITSPHLPQPHHSVPSSPLNPQYQQGVLLPPPHTMGRSPSASGNQLDQLADLAGQQYRAPSGSPMMPQGPMVSPGQLPPQAPPTAPYTHSFPPQQRPPSSTGHPPQWGSPFQPPYPMPPQNYPYPAPPNRPPFPRPELVAPENRQYNSPYNANQSPRPSISANTPIQAPRPQPSHISQPQTPLSQPGLSYITGSGTKWTPRPHGATPRIRTEPPRPQTEPISPILKPVKVPEVVEKSSGKKSTPAQPSKSQRRHIVNASSPVGFDAFRRSQSTQSHADELSLETDLPNRRVKQEVATPGGPGDIGDIIADESTNRRSRVAPSPYQSMKRKRIDSPEIKEPRGPPTFVLWTRAFPKISASALESISGHRNASTFANPVKERDAPGYKHLILRPQDLKSIRAAITAGNKAAAAIAASQPSSDDLKSSVWLPISEDLIPPKGIINYAQFEKELMRMFANAIMFNADPDRGLGRAFETKRQASEKGKEGYEIDENSLVKDTRAMFLDVEKDIGALRSAERRSEELAEREASGGPWGPSVGVRNRDTSINMEDDEVDELAGDGGAGDSDTVAKRRRKV